jgi:hypothetical protein
VTTIIPYIGTIDYGNSSSKSYKNKAYIFGIHATQGDLTYLIEADLSHTKIDYKESSNPNINQNNLSLVYGEYSLDSFYRIGIHYAQTDDTQLNDAIIAIGTFGWYKYYGIDKLGYGSNAYLSYYKDAHNEEYLEQSLTIFQISPYLSYYHPINKNWGNTLALILNYEYSADFIQKDYSWLELSDTLYHQSFYMMFRISYGEQRAGIRNGGAVVFNNLDLIKNGAEIRFGYYLKPNATLNISYIQNSYREFDSSFSTITSDNSNDAVFVSYNYSF